MFCADVVSGHQPDTSAVPAAGDGVAASVWPGLVLVNSARSFQELSVQWRMWRSVVDSVWGQSLRGVGVGKPVADVYFLAPSGGSKGLSDAQAVYRELLGDA